MSTYRGVVAAGTPPIPPSGRFVQMMQYRHPVFSA
jgi:hypothetical protein